MILGSDEYRKLSRGSEQDKKEAVVSLIRGYQEGQLGSWAESLALGDWSWVLLWVARQCLLGGVQYL